MSGPIIRKYGFPNFEQIFGKRDLDHGTPDPAAEKPAEAEPRPTTPPLAPEPSKSAGNG